MTTFTTCLLALLLGQTPAGTPEAAVAWLPPKGFVGEKTAAEPSELSPQFASERMWTRQADGWTERIVEVRTRKPMSLRRYLQLWRASHACALAPVPDVKPLPWAGRQQSTWSGSCEGGDVFVMHVARHGGTFFELHVGQLAGPSPSQGSSHGRELLARLLGEIEPPPADPEPAQPKRASRVEF